MSRVAVACLQTAALVAGFAAAGWALPRIVEDWRGHDIQPVASAAYPGSAQATLPGGAR